MKTLTVKAAPGVSVPLEGKPRQYITAASPATVPASAYYRRRIEDKDLVLVSDAEAKKGGK